MNKAKKSPDSPNCWAVQCWRCLLHLRPLKFSILTIFRPLSLCRPVITDSVSVVECTTGTSEATLQTRIPARTTLNSQLQALPRFPYFTAVALPSMVCGCAGQPVRSTNRFRLRLTSTTFFSPDKITPPPASINFSRFRFPATVALTW